MSLERINRRLQYRIAFSTLDRRNLVIGIGKLSDFVRGNSAPCVLNEFIYHDLKNVKKVQQAMKSSREQIQEAAEVGYLERSLALVMVVYASLKSGYIPMAGWPTSGGVPPV
ncbi:hypothetical protein VTN00DRAFT_2366 [Thermoascus crustaceus]|uniref:uncharacterized protein n=1 Tax=Thermoascus crustaceus TaxID=5088 RepID=UPI0037440684